MGSHTCPSPGCTVSVPRNMLACARHWYSIPTTLRDEVYRTYRAAAYEEEHLAAVSAAISFLEEKAADAKEAAR